MRLAAFATEGDVEEALRLFHVSTLEAAMSGSLEGAEGFTSQEEHDLILRVEKQLKRRFVIGSQVSEHAIIQDFARQVRLIPQDVCLYIGKPQLQFQKVLQLVQFACHTLDTVTHHNNGRLAV